VPYCPIDALEDLPLNAPEDNSARRRHNEILGFETSDSGKDRTSEKRDRDVIRCLTRENGTVWMALGEVEGVKCSGSNFQRRREKSMCSAPGSSAQVLSSISGCSETNNQPASLCAILFCYSLVLYYSIQLTLFYLLLDPIILIHSSFYFTLYVHPGLS
jgi:hypothetical protein